MKTSSHVPTSVQSNSNLRNRQWLAHPQISKQSYITILCLIIGGGGQIANFGEKNPRIHLIIIRELPKSTPPPF